MNKIKIFFLAISILFCSCNERTEVNINESVMLTHKIIEKAEVIDIEIDNTTLPYSFVYDFFSQESKFYLAWVNKGSNEISIFDLNDRSYVHKNIIPRKGPNGVKSISAIKMIDLNSVYISNSYGGEVIKYDLKARRREKTLDFFSNSKVEDYIFNSPTCKLELVNGRLYSCSQSPLNTYTDNVLLYNSSSVGRWVDVITGESGYGGMKSYPESYSDIFLPAEMWNYSREVVGEELMIYSFSCDHYIYIEDVETGKVDSKYCKSLNLPEVWPENTARDEYTDVRYKIEMPTYESVIYDSYRRVFYRIYRCSGEVENPNDIYKAMNEYRLRKVGVMVLNEKYEIIADQVLEGIYYSPDFFVMPDGLYISVENPASPKLNENKMSFSRIDVVER